MNYNVNTLILIAMACCLNMSCEDSPERILPIYNPSDFNRSLVDTSMQNIDKNHTVADFELINQNGKKITQKNYENSIYVTDFIFTRCPSICPVMTDHMRDLQKEFFRVDEVKFLSISVTPQIDSISVLKEYAIEKGVVDNKWNVVTGEKKHIYELARKSYFAVLTQGDGGLQDFIHTPNFILVDKKKQIRGIYDGTKENEIQRLIGDIKVLVR